MVQDAAMSSISPPLSRRNHTTDAQRRDQIKVLWLPKRRNDAYLNCELMMDAAAVISGHLKQTAE